MTGKIALEEHFGLEHAPVDPPLFESELQTLMFDTGPDRLRDMDANGIETAALSLTCPGVQGELDAESAVELATRANDHLADIVASAPGRYLGFAAVPLQDPERAAAELERAVRELGFIGALVNGYTNFGDRESGLYYDDERFDPFWAKLAELDVPLYLHPRPALPSQSLLYEDYPELRAAAWGFGVETAGHAIRLMLGGVFDRFPTATVVLGHLGEMLPFAVWRLQHRFDLRPHGRQRDRAIGDYLRENFYVTTSGNFASRPLAATLQEMGADRVLFAVDYPYESMSEGCTWFDAAPIDEADRVKIGRTNAERLLGLAA